MDRNWLAGRMETWLENNSLQYSGNLLKIKGFSGTKPALIEICSIKQHFSAVGYMCYMSTYENSKVCTALNAVFDLGLDKKYYQPKELNKKISR